MPCIDWKTFYSCIQQIQKVSDEISDGWTMNNENEEYNTFLAKKVVLQLEKSSEKGLISFEYHVAYNINFSVPVLCFKAWKSDGSQLQLEEIWSISNLDNDDLKTTLTQMVTNCFEDHPVLKMPFYIIHPCKTDMILDTLAESKNIIVSWLSVFGPVVNLQINEKYQSLT